MERRKAIKEGLFELDAQGNALLLAGHCGGCDRCHFPAAEICPYCSAEGCKPRALSRGGSLYLYTRVTNRPPGYRGEVPFGFGVVELPEGIRVITRLTESDPERLRFGQAVDLVVAPLHVDEEGCEVVTYAFAPRAE
jgi:uncharacterized OB-fold protein